VVSLVLAVGRLRANNDALFFAVPVAAKADGEDAFDMRGEENGDLRTCWDGGCAGSRLPLRFVLLLLLLLLQLLLLLLLLLLAVLVVVLL
jgi:hypothetical protein